MGWELEIGDETFTVTPVMEDQEIGTDYQVYWEGAATVSGSAVFALSGARVARLLGCVLLDQIDLLVRVTVDGHAQPLERRAPVMEREEGHLAVQVAARIARVAVRVARGCSLGCTELQARQPERAPETATSTPKTLDLPWLYLLWPP